MVALALHLHLHAVSFLCSPSQVRNWGGCGSGGRVANAVRRRLVQSFCALFYVLLSNFQHIFLCMMCYSGVVFFFIFSVCELQYENVKPFEWPKRRRV